LTNHTSRHGEPIFNAPHDGLPVHARALEPNDLYLVLVEPRDHLDQRVVEGLERARFYLLALAIVPLADRHHDRVLVHVDPGTNFEQRLHANLSAGCGDRLARG
jgi:hypothetical protein